MKKLVSVILTLAFLLGASASAFAAIPEYGEEYSNQPIKTYSQKFTDVNEEQWAFNYISEMSERGVLSGYPNGYFYPDNTITRAEFAKVMCLAASISVSPVSTTSYADVDANEWFAPYVEAGKYYLSGYVSDGQKYYMPNDNALREDIAVALVKLKGYDTSIYDESILKAMFTDYQSISEGARKYVSVAVEKGLISGYEDNTFRGQNTITRAEAATLLWRAYQYGNGNKVFEKEDFTEPVVTPDKPTETIPKEDPKKEDTEPKPTVEPIVEPEPEYLYNLKTIASGVSNVDSMVATDDGVIYFEKNYTNAVSSYDVIDRIMEVKKDSNKAYPIFETSEIPYLGDKELSKSEKNQIYSNILSIGYNQNDKCIYVIINQWQNIYVYNVTNKTATKKLELMKPISDGEYTTTDIRKTYLASDTAKTFVFNDSNNILISDYVIDDNKVSMIDNYWVSTHISAFINHKQYKFGTDGGYYQKSFIKILNKSGAWESLDFYAPNAICFAANNKSFYFRSENEIGTVNTDGDYTILCGIGDIDNTDGKSVRIRNIQHNTSAVDNNGVIYYWDIDYNCIRQLEHN